MSSPVENAHPGSARSLGSGAIAGVVAVFVFTVLHQILIDSIWWMFPIMAIAGALCGLCLAWCYATLVSEPSPRSWWTYIALFLVMFGLLTLASMLLYEPVISLAAMIASPSGNPLPMSDTFPLMAGFTVVWAVLMTGVFHAGWRGLGASLVTVAVLMLLLGFNLSTVGLVRIPREGWVLLAEFFGYVIVLGGVFGLTHRGLMGLGRRPAHPSVLTGTAGRD